MKLSPDPASNKRGDDEEEDDEKNTKYTNKE